MICLVSMYACCSYACMITGMHNPACHTIPNAIYAYVRITHDYAYAKIKMNTYICSHTCITYIATYTIPA